MILTDYFYPEEDLSWKYASQCGVEHAVLRLPEHPEFDVTDRTHWEPIMERLQSYGIRPLVIEPMPNRLHDHIKLGDEQFDESMESVIKMMRVMDQLNVRTICFNFMAGIGWTRTSSEVLERGGAKVTEFNLGDFQPPALCLSEQQLWQNYTRFVEGIRDSAEKYGIRLALHPDDPPISPLGQVGRIMTSYENIKHAMELGNSDYIGVTMCQATYHIMGEDLFEIIPKLKDKIFFVHFRNATGNKYHFRETFHDNGDIPMKKIIALYQKLGIDVPIRVDHVPTMAGEPNGNLPKGYEATGRLYAIGYLRGLLETEQ